MPHPARRLVAGPARHVGRGFDLAASGLSGAQCHGLVGPKIADRRRADRGRDMQQPGIVRDGDARRGQRQDGVAQVVAGEVARAPTGSRPTISAASGSRSGRRAPRPRSPRRSSARQLGVDSSPASAFDGPTAPGRKGHHRPAIVGQASAAPARPRSLRAARCSSRLAAIPASGRYRAPSGKASAPQRSIMRGSLLLAPAHVVEQAEARLADEAGALAECRRGTAPAPISRCAA